MVIKQQFDWCNCIRYRYHSLFSLAEVLSKQTRHLQILFSFRSFRSSSRCFCLVTRHTQNSFRSVSSKAQRSTSNPFALKINVSLFLCFCKAEICYYHFIQSFVFIWYQIYLILNNTFANADLCIVYCHLSKCNNGKMNEGGLLTIPLSFSLSQLTMRLPHFYLRL